MGIVTGIAIYFVIWWTTLFITLPFRVKSQLEAGEVVPGSDAAAPVNPQLGKRMFWNTVLSGIVFFLFWFIFYYLDYGLKDFPEVIEIQRLSP